MNYKSHYISLPLSQDKIIKYIDEFKDKDTVFVVNNIGTTNMEPHKILTFFANCEINNVGISTIFNDNFDNILEVYPKLVKEYLSFDRYYPITSINNDLYSILLKRLNYYDGLDFLSTLFKDNNGRKYIDRQNKLNDAISDICKDQLNELDEFFYSFSQIMSNMIDPNDKELDKKIKNADNNKLKYCNINIASLAIDESHFSIYLGLLNKDKMYIYDEFTKPCIEGESIPFKILKDFTLFQMMMNYNDYYRNPEKFTKKFNKVFNIKKG